MPIEPTLGPAEQTSRGTLVCSLDRKLTVGEAKDILALKNTLWFYGYIAYDDTFGFGRELRYIFRYDGGTEAVFASIPSKNFKAEFATRTIRPVRPQSTTCHAAVPKRRIYLLRQATHHRLRNDRQAHRRGERSLVFVIAGLDTAIRSSEEPIVTSASAGSLDGQTPEQRLRALGIELPPAAPAVGDYAPTAIAGTLLMTSGQLPWIAGELKFKGKIGADLSPEQGYQAFRLSALNAIAQLKAALGSPDRVKQVVRLEGTMGCAPGFTAQPSVLNGASHIVNQIFGPRGRHTRMIYSNNEMPMDCATLVVALRRDRARSIILVGKPEIEQRRRVG